MTFFFTDVHFEHRVRFSWVFTWFLLNIIVWFGMFGTRSIILRGLEGHWGEMTDEKQRVGTETSHLIAGSLKSLGQFTASTNSYGFGYCIRKPPEKP